MTHEIQTVPDVSQARAALEAILRLVQTRAQYVEDTVSDQQIAKLAQQALDALPPTPKPVKPNKCACGHWVAVHTSRGCHIALCECRATPQEALASSAPPALSRDQETQK